jgi:hypothetical protein
MAEPITQPNRVTRHALSSRVVFPVALLGLLLLGVVLGEAYRQQNRGDFWSVAVPGALTGVGTLALAAATVWVSLRESRRDEYLRQIDREAAEAGEATRRNAEALREARKVLANLLPSEAGTSNDGHAPYSADVEITNAGTEPIVDVNVTGVKLVKGEWDEPKWGRIGWDPGTRRYHSHLLSGETVRVGGSWIVHALSDDGEETADAMSLPDELWRSISMSIAWTDSAGRFWSRTGRELPVSLDQPWGSKDTEPDQSGTASMVSSKPTH